MIDDEKRELTAVDFPFLMYGKIKKGENIIPHHLNYTIHIKGNKTEFREIKVIIRQQIKFR